MGKAMDAQERHAAKAAFVIALQSDPNVSLACDVATISRKTAYQWREQDKAFKEAWDNAIERCHDTARSSIYKRGILGWDEAMVSMGQPVYTIEPVLDKEGKPRFDSKDRPLMQQGALLTVHKWSDTLAVAFAKANLPEYKDKPQVNVNAQLSDLAEQAKHDLLNDLAAAIAHEDQEPSH